MHMTNLLGYSLLFLFVLIVYKKLNNRFQEEKFRFKLHRLRNDLRNLGIEKKIDVNSNEFDFLDFSISKSIQQSYSISLFYLMALDLKHRTGIAKEDLDSYKKTYAQLLHNINRDSYLKEIEIKRNAILKEYITNQNKVTLFFVIYVIVLLFSIKWIKSKVKEIISSINYLPETSGISQLAYAYKK